MVINFKSGKKISFLIFFGVIFLVIGFFGVSVEKTNAASTGESCLTDGGCDSPCDECVGIITGTCTPMAGLVTTLCGDITLPWRVCDGNNRITRRQECTSYLGNRVCNLIDPVEQITCSGATPNCIPVGSSVNDWWAECQPSAAVCVPDAPTITVVPNSYSGAPTNQTFTINITRHDSDDCNLASVSLGADCTVDNPSWTSESIPPIAYNGTGTQTISVPITATQSCTIVTSSPDDSSKTGSATITINVNNNLSVVANKTDIPTGEGTLVGFTVKNNGLPVAGAAVSFSGAASGSCTLNTDAFGNCSATITPTSSNTITVTASYGTDTAFATINVTSAAPECTTDDICSNVSKAKCSTGTCVACTSNTNCAHFLGFSICNASGVCVTSSSSTTVSFGASCYQFVSTPVAATASYSGAAVGPNDSIVLYKPDGSESSCTQVSGASGTSNYNLNVNGVWSVKIHTGASCTTLGTVKATATTTVQAASCSGGCTPNTCNDSGQACLGGVWANCPSGTTCTDAGVCTSTASSTTCSGPGMYPSPLLLGYCTIPELIAAATNWILGIASSIIILVLIFGGIVYVTSAGDEERIRTAKNTILYAVIGLVIILLAYTLINEVKDILNVIP